MSPLDAIVLEDLDALSAGELEASYRAICAMVLCRTAVVSSQPAPPRRQEIEAKITARNWLAGSVGVITFPEACSAVSLDPDAARKRIASYADPSNPESISRRKRRPKNHYVFGRHHGRTNPLAARQDSPAGGVVAGPPDSPVDRSRHSGPATRG